MAGEEKTVLITGATSGIGLELAKLFAKDGYHLVIVARDQGELDATSRTLATIGKMKVTLIKKNLFDKYSAFEIYDELKSKGIQVDVLVNNAGQGNYGEFSDSDLKRNLDIIQLNISSLVTLTKLFLDDMIARGEGKILNTSSIASKTPGPWNAVYHATKAFVQSFTEAVRYEVKEKGISVSALLPGATDTDFWNKAGMQEAKIFQDKSKMSDPADVAKDGYDALMNGEDMIVSGLKNKLTVAMSAIVSDEKTAESLAKQNEPVDHKTEEKQKK